MNKRLSYLIPSLCKCGCNEVVWNGKEWIKGHYSKINNPMQGRQHSEETKRKIRKANTNPSIETRQKISIAKKGKHHTEEHKRKISEGCKGKNKGKHPSNESKRKNSNAHKGKHHSNETKERMRKSAKKGDLNAAKRPEVRAKISKALTGKSSYFKGKHHTEETKKIMSEKKKGKYCGEWASRWKGGKSFEPYCPKFNNQKKEEVRELYHRKCYSCNKNERNNITKNKKQWRLSIHHIDEDKEQGCNGKKFKLVPLCLECHNKLHNKYLSLI